MSKRPVLFFSTCTLLLCCAVAGAHGTTAGDLPLVSGSLEVRHRSSADIVALFSREEWSAAAPRGARAGNGGALLPPGIDGLLRSGDHGLTVVGFEPRFQALADCVHVIDAPVEKAAGRFRVTLTLNRASSRELRLQIARLSGGTAKPDGSRLSLEGSPQWLHRALRQVIRVELDLAASNSPLAP